MTLGWFPRAAILLVAPVLSVVAAAQSGAPTGQLDLPQNPTIVGRQDPGIRKATAIVNGEVITGSDIDQRLALIIASNSNIELPPEEVERARAQILRNLIDETLQIQAATQQEITITQQDIDNFYGRLAQNGRRTPEAMSTYLRSIGSSDQSLKRQIRGELAWQRLLRRQIEPFVTVGDEEVQAVLARLQADRGTTEYRVAEIFVSATPETAAQVQANAQRIVEQIRAGANFQAYARQYSEASTAAVGGELGWIRPAQLPAELAGLVSQMPVGAISNPIPVPGGFSILAVADQRQILVADARDAVLSLMQITLAMPTGATRAQAEARGTELGQATQSMGGCGHAQETATRLGAEVVANDQVRLRDLPPALQQMLINLSVGQATAPFGSQERISVLVMCGRDDPAPSTGPTFDQVYTQLNEERVNRRAQRYLRDLRRDAVVDYR